MKRTNLIKKSIFIALVLLIGINQSFSQNMINKNHITKVYSEAYKSYKRIRFKDLPNGIQKLMESCDCNLIEALNSLASSNDPLAIDPYDDGYTIELNDDSIPEYVFTCNEPGHGPGEGKIFSLINGEWKIINDNFQVFDDSKDSKGAIKVLETKTGGFHDLMDSYIGSKIIYKYINGKYLSISTPSQAIENIIFMMRNISKNQNSCYFGLTNNITSVDMREILKSNYTKGKESSLSFEALNSQNEANAVKKVLLAKGIHFINNYSEGQVIFYFSINPK